SLSGTLATMGPGVPYAIAAKFAHPDRPAIALVGDGAMQMNGLNELITVAKYWRRWSNPTLVVLVLNNRDLNQVTWEQRAMQGDPKFPGTQTIPDFPYAKFAELIGLKGVRVDDPHQAADAWYEALRADRRARVGGDARVGRDHARPRRGRGGRRDGNRLDVRRRGGGAGRRGRACRRRLGDERARRPRGSARDATQAAECGLSGHRRGG